jgi:hypothetical protein
MFEPTARTGVVEPLNETRMMQPRVVRVSCNEFNHPNFACGKMSPPW